MAPMNNRLLVPQKLPLLLDYAPGAAAAFSLRSLSNSYTGPVVTVRRSTDNAEADFTATEVSDNTLAAWCGGGDGYVKTWHDQSQHGRDASQSTAGYQPKLVSAGVVILDAEKPALQFDGVDDRLAVPSSNVLFKFLHDGTQSALFCVARFGESTNPGAFYSLAGSSGASSANVGFLVGYYDISPINDRLSVSVARGISGVLAFNATVDDNIKPARQTILSLLYDVASNSVTERVRMHVDAALVSNGNTFSDAPSSSNATYDMQIGASGASTFPLLGTISELIIYPTDMTALRTRIEGDLAWYY